MESIGRRSTATSTNVTSAVVGLLLSPSRPPVTTITSNSKPPGLCHIANPRVPLQHSSNGGNVISHEQYAPIFQEQHSGQLITPPTVPAVSTSPIIMPPSNITTAGMELSPFGILPHERVVPQHAHHRQHRKFPVCPQFTKTMDTDYEPRTTSQPVGYLSVITRTTNSVTMDNMATNNNYYQAQPLPLPLQTKTSDNHDRQYYHFENTVPPNQTPQHQLDNILLMGAPVQRGDPMHIVKNLQSMQTDIDCYGVKKMIEQQPRIISTDIGKSVGPPTLINNISGKRIIENQQLPKSVMINPSYNGQYFNRRQPPPAHLYPHHGQANLQQNIMIGNTYLDVHRHPNWNLEHQKPHTVSTTSCFTGNVSSGVFHQSILQQSQPYNNTASTFNIQPPVSSIPQLQQMPVPTHNNFTVSTANPTYYAQTPSTVSPMTSVSTSSPSIFNRQHHNSEPQNPDFQDFPQSIQTASYVVNEENRSTYTPHVVVPNIEEELSHLCDETMSTTNATVKPLNVKPKQPSFIDSYIKFLNGGAGSVSKSEMENNEKTKKLLHPLLTSMPKPISKPYIPISKPKVVTAVNEQTLPPRSNGEDIKKTTNLTTSDEDPRYFPLPKTSSSILDEKSDGSNHEKSWSDQEQDQWWITSSFDIKKKKNANKKIKKNTTQKKKPLSSNAAVKKQSTQEYFYV